MSATVLQDSYLAELSRVEYSVGRVRILCGLSFCVHKGECAGIIGPNGAGKSTLLGLMNATVRPSSGEVRVFGESPWTQPEGGRAHLRSRVATVLQRSEYSSMAPLPAREVVAMGRLGYHGLFGRISQAEQQHIDETLEQLAIGHLARRAYRDLSGGEQQKMQIARALVQDPEFLLLDEPTAGLDIDWQDRLVALIDDLSRSRGLTIVMTTHALHHLPPSCTRVILLRQGRILFDGEPETALTPERVGDLYGCPVDIMERNGRRYCLGAGEGR